MDVYVVHTGKTGGGSLIGVYSEIARARAAADGHAEALFGIGVHALINDEMGNVEMRVYTVGGKPVASYAISLFRLDDDAEATDG